MGCRHHPTGLPQAPGPGQAAATVTRPAGARPAADATARPDGHTGRAASTQTQPGRSLAIPPGKALRPGPFVVTAIQIVIIGIAVVAMLGVHLLLRHTRLGQAMRATATNAALARNCGIRTDLVIDMVWLLSGILCGIGGVALVANITSFDFGTGGQFIILILTAAVLGGVGQPYGAMIGALVIGVASEVSAAIISPAYKELIAFVILVVVLLIRPQGILSEIAAQKEVVAA